MLQPPGIGPLEGASEGLRKLAVGDGDGEAPVYVRDLHDALQGILCLLGETVGLAAELVELLLAHAAVGVGPPGEPRAFVFSNFYSNFWLIFGKL